MKVMRFQATDGVGVLAYAGLGATSQGTQPSDWMSAVLRRRGGLTFEQALEVLSAAANRELPQHLEHVPGTAHFIIIPAFVGGVGRLYSIDNVVEPKTHRLWYRCTSHHNTTVPGSPSPRIVVAGTGGIYLESKGRSWARDVLRLVNAHDRGRVSDYVIADHLAKLNYEAHQKVGDGSVGPSCVVIWCRRPNAPSATGSAHQFYRGTERDTDSTPIPSIANGLDVTHIGAIVIDAMQEARASGASTKAAFDLAEDKLAQHLAKAPWKTDEKLG
jgi:hypothetical protein